jgi:riboflavin transporter FmnP
MLGIVMFLLVPLLYVNGARAAILGGDCLFSQAFLIAGLYVTAFTSKSWMLIIGQTVLALLLNVLMWLPLYQVIFHWTRDEELSNTYLDRIAIVSTGFMIAAVLTMFILKIKRKEPVNNEVDSISESHSNVLFRNK